MSQRAVEAVLGKLICDDGFRTKFYQDPEDTVACSGLVLTPVELSSLHGLKRETLTVFAAHLDDRIRRAAAPLSRRGPKAAGGRGS